MFLTPTQKAIAKGMAGGIGLTSLGLCIPFLGTTLPSSPPGVTTYLSLWLPTSTIVIFWLLISVARMAKHRFVTTLNGEQDMGPADTLRTILLQAVLQNTLEQAALAVIAYGIWLQFASAAWAILPVLFCAYFSVGRLLFFRSYNQGAAARSFGFSLTFFPTAALLIIGLPRALTIIFRTYFPL